ncbi:MAG TPA: 50S ribosomal protein L28, partial [Candidatus Brocadiia bacterium]|nr:50S ribosomal protein L28 [Candidatus Brocadiia bacterium]
MGRECEICGKGTTVGNRITRRGMAKAKGGVGRKTTGIARRTFKPNLQVVKTNLGGRVRRIRVC